MKTLCTFLSNSNPSSSTFDTRLFISAPGTDTNSSKLHKVIKCMSRMGWFF